MAEKEYIEREALQNKAFGENHPTFYDGQDIADWYEKCINETPAADVAPVRHGRWNKWNYAPNRKAIFLDSVCEQYKTLGYPHRIILAFQCSECNMVSMVDKTHGKYDFCPICGAKMDEEEKSDV